MIPTVNVTFTVRDHSGAAVPNAKVSVKLSAIDLYQGEYVYPVEMTYLADVNGLVTMPLFPNAIGEKNTFYQLKAQDAAGDNTYLNTTMVVPNQATTLDAIAGTGPATPENSYIGSPMNIPFYDQTGQHQSVMKNFNTAPRVYTFPNVAGTVIVAAGVMTTGLLTVTATDPLNVIGRTITGTANQISVTNGNGVAGNPTISLTAPLVAPGAVQVVDGTSTAPGISFSAETNTGFYRSAATRLAVSVAGNYIAEFNALGNGGIAANQLSLDRTNQDVVVVRDAPNTMAIKNGIAGQTLRVYGSTTGNKYLQVSHDGSNAYLLAIGDSGADGLVISGRAETYLRCNGNSLSWKISAGHLLAEQDNVSDIGASGLNRPRNYYGAGSGTFGGSLFVSGGIEAGGSQALGWAGRSTIKSPADGIITLSDVLGTDFLRLQFGGTTSAFPALKRVNNGLEFRLADDSNWAYGRAQRWYLQNGTFLSDTGDGLLMLTDATGLAFGRLMFGGATSSYPAIKRSGAGLDFKLADDSAFASISVNDLAANRVIASGAGPHAIGGATDSNKQLRLLGTFSAASSVNQNAALAVETTVNVAANGDADGVFIAPTLAKAATGTHANLVSLTVSPPIITAGAAALTYASTVKITGAPTAGTKNYALWGTGGVLRWDGRIDLTDLSGMTPAFGIFDVADLSNGFYLRKVSPSTMEVVTRSGGADSPQFRVAHTASTVNYAVIQGGATGNGPSFTASGSDASIGMYFNTTGSGEIRFRKDAGATELARFDGGTLADGNTALLIRRNVGGTLSLQTVSMGAVDSGGAGFKVLRVPN